MTSRFLGAVCVGVFTLGVNTSSNAENYGFTKIFDTNDPMPNGMGNFTKFSWPSLDGRDIAFAGTGDSGYQAVYTYIDGNLNLVADTNTPIPGGTGNFVWFSEPVINNGNVALPGGVTGPFNTSPSAQNGIYTNLGGSLRVVVDLNTPVPGGTGTFFAMKDEDFSISNGVVAVTAFSGPAPGRAGVYADINGTLSVIADQNTPAPDGSGNFDTAAFSGMNGNDVAFGAINTTVNGEYLNSGGTISTIIDSNTLIPGSTNTFDRFLSAGHDVAEGTFAIVNGLDSAHMFGLYSNVGGTLHLVVEIGDTTPDGIGSFTSFGNLGVDDGEVAFMAGEDNGDVNIYRYFGGDLDEVISIGNMLDGKTVTDLGTYPADSFDDSVIAFLADFEDGSSGIYLAEVSNVPLPPAVWLFGSGLLGLVGIARRRKAA